MYLSFYLFQIFGTVDEPPGIVEFNASTPSGIGIVIFVSNIIKLIMIIAGLFGLFNIISAGFTYLSSAGNAKATEQAMSQLNYSLIGLILIVTSFTITSIISYLLFGDASYILNPRLPSVLP